MFSIIAVLLLFSVLVIIHELGHYLAARLMGVRVEKFSIGFPPTLFSKKIGETEFCISAIPLGGYVKMAGFVDESMDTKVTGADDEYSSKPVWKRMVIISAGVIMNLILAVVIFTFINFYQGETITPTTKVEVTSEQGIAQKIGFKDGDKILQVNNQAVNNWNEISSEFLNNIDNNIVFQVNRNGQSLNLTYKKEWFSNLDGASINIAPQYEARIGEISPDYPAQLAGLQSGDMIESINGIQVSTWQEMSDVIKANAAKDLSLTINRDGQILEKSVKPREYIATKESGDQESYGVIGVRPYTVNQPVSFSQAFVKGLIDPFAIIYLNIKGIWWMISGVKPASESIGGPITIAKMAADAANAGWDYYWRLVAILSSVLAFFNILPIPALDGGHLALLTVEGIIRRPLSIKTRLIVQQVGMALLLSLIIFVLYIDINRLSF